MGDRIVRAIEELLLKFEARMVTFMIWLCWVCGITTDEVERYREQQKGKASPTSAKKKPRFPPEPRLPPRTAPLPKRK